MEIVILLVSLFLLCFLEIPIAVVISVLALVGMWLGGGDWTAMLNASLTMFDGATSFPMLAIPLFVLAGALMNSSSISRRLLDFTSALVGFVSGGLAIVTVGAAMLFAEISGSAVAGVAALGTILIPAMVNRGYAPTFATAITSSSCTLAIVIPPSIPMIIYGSISDTSILKLFVGGIVPGVLGAFGLMVAAYIIAKKKNLPKEDKFEAQNIWRAFKNAAWALLLPIIILGGIFSGQVTATEGAGLAVVASLFIGGVVYRELSFSKLKKALADGVLQTGVVMLLVATSKILSLYLTEIQLPQLVTEAIMGITTNKYAVLALLNVLILVIGMFLHGAAAIILTVPILMPLIHQLGIDPIHFGIILTLNLAIGQQTPPVASVLATACTIGNTEMWQTTKANIPFLIVLFLLLMVVTYIPAIPMVLINLFY